MNHKKILLENINKTHTTKLGIERIKKNLNLTNEDPIKYCKKIIEKETSKVEKQGKNYYCKEKNIIITINSNSFTIITAHKRIK